MGSTMMDFQTLLVTTPKTFVYHVKLNRPAKYNAMNSQMWQDIKDCFEWLATNPDCRAVVLSGEGKHFTAGLDLIDAMSLGDKLAQYDDVARRGWYLEQRIKYFQDAISSVEKCNRPVIAAIHKACLGAGVDLITAADIRYCTKDAFFEIKEVDIGMAPDVGTLQRFPKVIYSQSLARELCFTGRRFHADEAKSCGLVGRVFDSKDAMIDDSIALAEVIASKSPIAVQATKKNMVYSLSRPNQEGLDQICEMNKLYLQSEDFVNAAVAQMNRSVKPTFAKL